MHNTSKIIILTVNFEKYQFLHLTSHSEPKTLAILKCREFEIQEDV